MDALVVKERFDAVGDPAVVVVVAADVRRRDDLVAGQLPDVQLVDGHHVRHLVGEGGTEVIAWWRREELRSRPSRRAPGGGGRN